VLHDLATHIRRYSDWTDPQAVVFTRAKAIPFGVCSARWSQARTSTAVGSRITPTNEGICFGNLNATFPSREIRRTCSNNVRHFCKRSVSSKARVPEGGGIDLYNVHRNSSSQLQLHICSISQTLSPTISTVLVVECCSVRLSEEGTLRAFPRGRPASRRLLEGQASEPLGLQAFRASLPSRPPRAPKDRRPRPPGRERRRTGPEWAGAGRMQDTRRARCGGGGSPPESGRREPAPTHEAPRIAPPRTPDERPEGRTANQDLERFAATPGPRPPPPGCLTLQWRGWDSGRSPGARGVENGPSGCGKEPRSLI
jgi:hypothetical protein